MTNLVLHLGVVHRAVSRVIGERMQQPPERGDMPWLGLAEEWRGWLPPARAPQRSPVPAGLLGWFHDGSADLHARFRATAPEEQVWTWSADHSVGFWQRMQAIEAAVHRWDAENAVGAVRPLDAALAADAIGQTFEVMAPMRRSVGKAPPGHGERFVFQRTDGPGRWVVRFDGDAAGQSGYADAVRLTLLGRVVNSLPQVMQAPLCIMARPGSSLTSRQAWIRNGRSTGNRIRSPDLRGSQPACIAYCWARPA